MYSIEEDDIPSLLKPQEDLGINADMLENDDPEWAERGIYSEGWMLKVQAC